MWMLLLPFLQASNTPLPTPTLLTRYVIVHLVDTVKFWLWLQVTRIGNQAFNGRSWKRGARVKWKTALLCLKEGERGVKMSVFCFNKEGRILGTFDLLSVSPPGPTLNITFGAYEKHPASRALLTILSLKRDKWGSACRVMKRNLKFSCFSLQEYEHTQSTRVCGWSSSHEPNVLWSLSDLSSWRSRRISEKYQTTSAGTFASFKLCLSEAASCLVKISFGKYTKQRCGQKWTLACGGLHVPNLPERNFVGEGGWERESY